MLATLFFLLALALITSTLSTIVRDVQQIVHSVLKMMLYLTPLLWHTDKLVVKGVELALSIKTKSTVLHCRRVQGITARDDMVYG